MYSRSVVPAVQNSTCCSYSIILLAFVNLFVVGNFSLHLPPELLPIIVSVLKEKKRNIVTVIGYACSPRGHQGSRGGKQQLCRNIVLCIYDMLSFFFCNKDFFYRHVRETPCALKIGQCHITDKMVSHQDRLFPRNTTVRPDF